MNPKKIPSIRELRVITQAAKDHRGEWRYRIHRKISIYVTWLLLHTRMTGNQVSILGFVCGIAGGVLVLAGGKVGALLGLFFFYGYFLLDKVDGEIARFRRGESVRGICLDYIGHMGIPPLVPLSVGGFLAGETDGSLFWLSGGLAALAVLFERAGRDIPYSILVHKAPRHPGLFRTRREPDEDGRITGGGRGRITSRVIRVARTLTSLWPSLLFLGTGVILYSVRESLLAVLEASFLLLCLGQVSLAVAGAYRLARRIDDAIPGCREKMQKVLKITSPDG